MTANQITPFSFEDQQLRVLERDGDPWFVLADVCRVLEHSNPSVVAGRLDDDEKDTLNNNEGIAGAQVQALTIVNESGLYSLILTSRKPAAKRFKKWVTADVLPSLRKTGSYGAATPNPAAALNDPASLRALLLENVEKVIALEARVEADKPKTSFYDAFINTDGLYTLQNAGRAMECRPNLFARWLKQDYLFYQGTALVPRVRFLQMGIFEVKSEIVDDKARPRTFVTTKGIEYLSSRVPAEVKLAGRVA